MSEQLTWMPAWRIRELVAGRQVSPVEVVDHFLGRIAEHNGTLKAFKVLDENGAREQAKRAEDEVMRGDDLGPLHGIPMSVKEHIPVKGFHGMGGMGFAGGTAKRDALGVTRLRQAGAVIVGTNTMMGTSGGMGGKLYNWEREARNPWDPNRVPGWSSSGGAAAASARLLPITIGSDGGGSTRLPAAYSGIVGVHPTAGLIPTINYDSPTLPPLTVSIGPLCRDVKDAAITLQVMAGPDGRDFTCIQAQPGDYLTDLDVGVEGMRFAWTDDYGFAKMYAQGESAGVIAAVRGAAMGFNSLGASVEPTTEVWEDFWPGYLTSNYLFGVTNMPVPRPPEDEWANALDTRQRNWERFRAVLGQSDLLLSATSQILPRTVEEWDAGWVTDGAKYTHGTFAPTYTSHTHMFNWLGFPAVSVPCGFIDGLPIALQIVGLPGSEAKIFRASAAFQKAFPRDERPPVS